MRELFRQVVPFERRLIWRDHYYAAQNFLRRRIFRTLTMVQAWQHFPPLRDYARQRKIIRARLEPPYIEYVGSVSTPDYAISLETAILLLALCEAYQPRHLLDLGSGFSSYVFRLYAAGQPQAQVISVDDDASWLQKTENYLRQRGTLSTENILQIDDFQQQFSTMQFDLILHDIGKQFRWTIVPALFQQVTPGSGLLIFDDMHRVDYRQFVRASTQNAGGRYLDLTAFTLDGYQRFAGIGSHFSVLQQRD